MVLHVGRLVGVEKRVGIQLLCLNHSFSEFGNEGYIGWIFDDNWITTRGQDWIYSAKSCWQNVGIDLERCQKTETY